MHDAHLQETTVESRVLHSGRYLRLRIDTIEDGTGRRHEREIVEHPGAVVIAALAGEDILLVRQFRTAVGRVLLELPAGTLERDAAGVPEEPAAAAARELAEETGYRAGSWRDLGSFYTAPGFCDEHMHLFLAADLEQVAGYSGPETDERLELVRLPWREAVAMAETGRLADAKSLVGLMRLARILEADVSTDREPG